MERTTIETTATTTGSPETPTVECAEPTGIGPVDERTGGLSARGLFLLSCPPVPARTAAVLQFLEAGLDAGEQVALVTRSRPDRIFEAADRFGCRLEPAWRDGRLTLVGYQGDYEARLRRAASPEAVFAELRSLLDPVPARVAFDPGTALWEGRGDGSAASALVDFVDAAGVVALATTTGDLSGELPLATELVSQAASGIFELGEGTGGVFRLSIRKFEEGRPEQPDVTLALRDGEGLGAPGETPARRSSDRPAEGRGELLWLALEDGLSEEVESWIRAEYRVTDAEEPLELVSRLQTDEPYGIVLVSLTREHLTQGLRACGVCCRLRPGLPVVVVSGEPLRASDRADLLRAGADECMTGGLNVDELGSRLELAGSRSGARPEPPGPAAANGGPGGEPLNGGNIRGDGPAPEDPLDDRAFRRELRKRMSTSGSGVFSIVRFSAQDPRRLAATLHDLVRTDEGDFAGVLDGTAAVWLSGTVPAEADGFVRRVRESVREAAGVGWVAPEVLGSVRDTERLRELAG